MAAHGNDLMLNTLAPDFRLLGVDEKFYTLSDCRGDKGLVVAFICNHCPYVQSIQSRLIDLAHDLQAIDIGIVAINSNDASGYPDDDFPSMQRVAKELAYPFPYLYDETQEVAQAYQAVCTPDFFGFNALLKLQYRGRLEAGGKVVQPHARRELFEAMQSIAQTGTFGADIMPSLGCSIKWRS